MSADNEIVSRLFHEVWTGGDLSALEEIMHPECRARSGADTTLVENRDQYQKMVAGYLAIFGSVEMTVDAQVANDGIVATRWTARVMSKPDQVGFMGMSFHRLVDDVIVECWDTWDSLKALETFEGDVLAHLTMASG